MFKKILIKNHSHHKEHVNYITQKNISLEEENEKFVEDNCLHCKKIFLKKNKKESFCCHGCSNVYHFLVSNDLSKYYEIMKNVGESPSTAEDYSESQFAIFRDENLSSIFKLKNGQWAFFIPEIKCAACIWLIEKTIQFNKNINNINVNLMDKIVSFSIIESSSKSLEEVAKKLILSGYNVLPLPFMSSKEFRSKYEKERIKDIGISGFAFGNVMIFAASSYFGSYFGIDAGINKLFILLSMIISVPATLFAGRSFFMNSWKALKHKKVHIDTSISFALIVSLGVSIYETYLDSGKVYYDTITGLVFLLLVGRYFHEKSLHKASELGESIKNILPIEAYSIQKGQKLIVPAGKSFLADGYIIEGETEVNEASLTGEEYPVFKKVMDHVLAGSQNILQPVTIIAEKTGNETWVSSLENLIFSAKSRKSRVESMMEKILPVFTLSIIVTAFLSAGVWAFISWQKALDVFVAILIISCPCALGLATPLAMSSALKRLWEKGVIVKSQEAIETITTIDTVIFDKTGTLTEGNLSILSQEIIKTGNNQEVLPIDIEKMLATFALLAKNSLHLVSKAITKEFQNKKFHVQLNNIREFAGKGIQAEVGNFNTEIKIGRADFVGISENEDEINYNVYGKYGDTYFKFCLSEKIQDGAEKLINFLTKKNIESFILSGDKIKSVSKIANKIGVNIQNCFASLLPEEKLFFLEKMQNHGKKVMAIGDGVNDAAMLAKAHISIASHGGTDIALHSADIFLWNQGVSLIQKTFQYCKYVNNTLRILIFVSLFYNLLAICLAILGYVNPLFAALFMPISSLTVYFIVFFRKGNKIWE